jgi:hypothetical protein
VKTKGEDVDDLTFMIFKEGNGKAGLQNAGELEEGP